ncbi:hypothetical protein PV413_03530 [Streptomyces scabiei]|uniref:hypothetical protein n=1 Tax=Streptomyces scabiei TaxID=1930 RepID=UPI000E68BD3E|nr:MULTISPECIES: hypothetical protein [Streptomyces]MDX2749587.1 hypothetical protein [Streptomyces scabiei]MDX3026779.1 hypothetical protein [Streptomyces scabiei]MDX3146545.1 hypothetical protein [Streptomyces scabiei]MDX3196951.1 hypothetical protein [Streptomyces scabiei]MDX3210057.1 hypothetical protein [Streptomyces scabiei]
MTQLKFDAKVSASAQEALEAHVRPMYDQPGSRRMAIIEFAAIERVEPAPGTEKEPSVRVRIVGLELPNREQEGAVREAQRFLHLQRTARGTFDDDGQLELSESTLRLTGGMLAYLETARLRAGLAHWRDYAHRLVHGPDLTITEVRHEMQALAEGLTAILNTAHDHPDGDDG